MFQETSQLGIIPHLLKDNLEQKIIELDFLIELLSQFTLSKSQEARKNQILELKSQITSQSQSQIDQLAALDKLMKSVNTLQQEVDQIERLQSHQNKENISRSSNMERSYSNMKIFKSRQEPFKTPESGKNQFEDTIILSLSPTPFKDQFQQIGYSQNHNLLKTNQSNITKSLESFKSSDKCQSDFDQMQQEHLDQLQSQDQNSQDHQVDKQNDFSDAVRGLSLKRQSSSTVNMGSVVTATDLSK